MPKKEFSKIRSENNAIPWKMEGAVIGKWPGFKVSTISMGSRPPYHLELQTSLEICGFEQGGSVGIFR
jgi:hypothetical protein